MGPIDDKAGSDPVYSGEGNEEEPQIYISPAAAAGEPEENINPSSPQAQGESATSDVNVNPTSTHDTPAAASPVEAGTEHLDEVPTT